MSVFSKIGSFLNRHRTKFFVGGVIITGSVLLTRYAQYRLREWHQNEAKEFYERTKKQQHFESTERTCNQTILSLMVALNEALNKSFNIEEVLADLRGNPDNKVELWNKLKVLVFTKLNILGGYLYKDPASISLEMQEKYLSLCHSLLNSGIPKLAQKLTTEYGKVLEVVPLNRQLKLTEIENIFWTIQVALREDLEDPIRNLQQYVVLDNAVIPTNIVRDTAELLQSEEVTNIANSCVSHCFTVVGDQIAEFYGPPTMNDNFVHPSSIKIPVAKLIPIINGLTNTNSLLDVLIQQLLINDKLKTLGANVYEAFSFCK